MRTKYPKCKYIIGDVRDAAAIGSAVKGQDVVIHAAALKHVLFCAKNPIEAYKTNVIGTQNVIMACLEAGVQKAIYINTDKSIRPISTYGYTKALAYELWDMANKSKPIFSTVLLGNMIDSSGSVLEIYKRLLAEGVKELPLSHADGKRFFTNPEQFCEVLETILHVKEPCVLQPEMALIKIADIIDILGGTPKVTGLTIGEKICEDAYGDGEMVPVSREQVQDFLIESGVI